MSLQQLYQYITTINYERELWAFRHSVNESTFRTYDPMNVSKSDDMMELIVSEVEEDDIVFDIGANVGNYSFSTACFGAESHAFEPDPDMFRYLKKNCSLNADLDVSVHQIAVADTDTEATFYRSQDRGSGSLTRANAERMGLKETVETPVRQLDTLAADIGTPNIIKIDAEGQLIDILEGASEILSKTQPRIVFEPHNDHRSIDYTEKDYRELLERYAYTLTERGRFIDAQFAEDTEPTTQS